jgi:hypothetical protein
VHTAVGRPGPRPRKRADPLVAGPLLLSALVAPRVASAVEPSGTTLINETFDARTSPANFGFPVGAGVSDGVSKVTQGMGNYTTSVRQFA